MKKLIFLFIFLSMVWSVSAFQVSLNDDAARYNGQLESGIDGSANWVVSCPETSGGCDPAPETLSVCGTELNLKEGSPDEGYTFENGWKSIPDDIACSVGSKDIIIIDENGGNEVFQDEIFIDSYTMDEFYGKYLYVNMEADPADIKDFYISNDTWGEDHSIRPDPEEEYPDSNSAWVMVNELDAVKKDDSAAYEASKGNTLEVDSNNLAAILDDVPSENNHDPGNTILTSTGGNEGACEEGPCAIVNNIDIGTDANYNDVEIGNFQFLPESVTSAHRSYQGGGQYRPEGEIMVGSKPKHANGGPDSDGPYFFVCTDGATMNNGEEEVDQVINVSDGSGEDLYQCQPDQEEWSPVDSCNDGLDNDNDGTIDSGNSDYHEKHGGEYDKESCGEANANNEYVSNDYDDSCEEGVKYETVNDPTEGSYEALVAQYEQDGDCSTEGTIETGDDIVYEAWKDSVSFEPQTYMCEEDTINPGQCARAEEDDPDIYGMYDEVEVVEFYPENAYLNQYEGRLSDGEVVETGFVDDEGWKPKYESLVESKSSYAPNIDDVLYSYSTWKDRIRSPEVEEAYESTDNTFDNHVKAWDVANAGATNSDVSSAGTPFSGGYYGLCEEQEAWQDTGENWECSGEIEWDQAVHLPEFEGPDQDSQMDVGLIVMGYNNQDDWDDYVNYPDTNDRTLGFDSDTEIGTDEFKGWMSYPLATEDALHRNQDTLDYMNATCWAGGPDNRPNSSIENDENEGSRYLEWDFVDVKEGVPYGVTGRLDSSSDQGFDLAEYDGYTCNWEYQTDSSGAVNVSGDVRELHAISSNSGTSNLNKAEWSAVSSVDPEFARAPSPPVSFEEGIAASRSMAEAMGWLETPQTIFENIGDSVIPEGDPSGSTTFDVLGYEGDGSNVKIVTDDTYTPFYGDELDDESCSALNEYDHPYSSYSGIPAYSDIDHVYSASPPSSSWGPDDDGEEPEWECPEWFNDGSGINGEPVEVPTVIDFIEQDGERPDAVEFGEEGNPIANFMAAYNDPGNGMLKLTYQDYQELQDNLDAWENRAN